MSELLEKIFKTRKPIIGMIHLKPLPYSPLYKGSFEEVIESAMKDAKALVEANIDGLLIENYGDKPYFKNEVELHTIASMGIVEWEIKKNFNVPIGINVLRNASKVAMAIASITGASFIRVNVHAYALITDQGIIEGNAAELLRYRTQLNSNVKIFADVLSKHAFPLFNYDIQRIARDTYFRALADALIVTGPETGKPLSLDDLIKVKETTNAPVLAGSGVNIDNVESILKHADGAIVGTYFKKDGIINNEVDEERVLNFMKLVEKIRQNI